MVNDDVNVVPLTITPKLPISDGETTPVKEIEKVSKFNWDLRSHLISNGATPPLIPPSILIVGPFELRVADVQSWTPESEASAERSAEALVVSITSILNGGLQPDSSITSTL